MADHGVVVHSLAFDSTVFAWLFDSVLRTILSRNVSAPAVNGTVEDKPRLEYTVSLRDIVDRNDYDARPYPQQIISFRGVDASPFKCMDTPLQVQIKAREGGTLIFPPISNPAVRVFVHHQNFQTKRSIVIPGTYTIPRTQAYLTIDGPATDKQYDLECLFVPLNETYYDFIPTETGSLDYCRVDTSASDVRVVVRRSSTSYALVTFQNPTLNYLKGTDLFDDVLHIAVSKSVNESDVTGPITYMRTLDYPLETLGGLAEHVVTVTDSRTDINVEEGLHVVRFRCESETTIVVPSGGGTLVFQGASNTPVRVYASDTSNAIKVKIAVPGIYTLVDTRAYLEIKGSKTTNEYDLECLFVPTQK